MKQVYDVQPNHCVKWDKLNHCYHLGMTIMPDRFTFGEYKKVTLVAISSPKW